MRGVMYKTQTNSQEFCVCASLCGIIGQDCPENYIVVPISIINSVWVIWSNHVTSIYLMHRIDIEYSTCPQQTNEHLSTPRCFFFADKGQVIA